MVVHIQCYCWPVQPGSTEQLALDAQGQPNPEGGMQGRWVGETWSVIPHVPTIGTWEWNDLVPAVPTSTDTNAGKHWSQNVTWTLCNTGSDVCSLGIVLAHNFRCAIVA